MYKLCERNKDLLVEPLGVIVEDVPLVIIFQHLAQCRSRFVIDTGPDSGDEGGGRATRRREEIVGGCRHDGLVKMGSRLMAFIRRD